MLLVARKNLFSERTRLIISVGGVALSVFLITFLLSLFRGWNEKVGGFVENVDADVWVAREGTTDFLVAASILPLEGLDEQLSRIQSVEQWSPLIVRPMAATKDGTEMDVELVGFDTESGMGGPVHIKGGEGGGGPGGGNGRRGAKPPLRGEHRRHHRGRRPRLAGRRQVLRGRFR